MLFFCAYISAAHNDKIYTPVCVATSLLCPYITVTVADTNFFIESIIHPKYTETTEKLVETFEMLYDEPKIPSYCNFFDKFVKVLSFNIREYVYQVLDMQKDDKMDIVYKQYMIRECIYCKNIFKSLQLDTKLFKIEEKITLAFLYSLNNKDKIKNIITCIFNTFLDFVEKNDNVVYWRVGTLINLHGFVRTANTYFTDIRHTTRFKGFDIILNNYNNIRLYQTGFVAYLQVEINIKNACCNINNYYFKTYHNHINGMNILVEIETGKSKIWTHKNRVCNYLQSKTNAKKIRYAILDTNRLSFELRKYKTIKK